MRSINVPNQNPFRPRVCIRIPTRNAIAFWRSAFVGLTDRLVGLPERHFDGSANPAFGVFPPAFGENWGERQEINSPPLGLPRWLDGFCTIRLAAVRE